MGRDGEDVPGENATREAPIDIAGMLKSTASAQGNTLQ
jgi:hypothetical protein